MNYLFPIRIVDAKDAQDTAALLKEKTLQIGLADHVEYTAPEGITVLM